MCSFLSKEMFLITFFLINIKPENTHVPKNIVVLELVVRHLIGTYF